MDQSKIRNFCIIAHIDHGKSTLADRLLELTHTVEKRKMKNQMLDQMDLERERGITIKLQPVRMLYSMPRTSTDFTRTNTDRGLLYEDLTYKIRGAVFEVRKQLGSGQKEGIYQKALEIEFQKRGIPFEKEKTLNILYDDKKVGIYRPDFVIEDKIIVELKALQYIGKQEEHQVWHYLKGTLYRLALLVNFSPQGADIRRLIHDKSPQLSVFGPSESVYQLNLIDTPGHVDFTYEVSRSLAACEGAILVVDATQGIQAQTLANINLALEHKLKIIPVINKIDLPNAGPEETALEMKEAFGFKDEEILFVSAKTGENVEKILQKVVEVIPPPPGDQESPLQALIFDSKFDKHRGVVTYIRIVNGSVSTNDKILMMVEKVGAQALEVGYFAPEFKKAEKLFAGEVGYIVTGLREVGKARVGDTVTLALKQAKTPLPGYKDVKPMVFASIFPASGDDYHALRDAMEKLKLNDASLTFEPENIPSLGFGFLTGFLGLLHMEIVQERLKREFGLTLVLTAPSVAYAVSKKGGQNVTVYSPAELPDLSEIISISEPWAKVEVLTPEKYLGGTMTLATSRRGIYKSSTYLGPGRLNLNFELPLSNIISDFYDKLKSVSSGYASMNYKFLDYRPGDLVKLDVLVAGDKVDALSLIIHQDSVDLEGRRIVEKLKELIPRQLFAVALQAAIGGKIIARETIPALRKDVTAKLYGGDVTRKMKLLKKQKKGKKRMQALGKVNIPQEAFLQLMKK